jgi:hypothetical protein
MRATVARTRGADTVQRRKAAIAEAHRFEQAPLQRIQANGLLDAPPRGGNPFAVRAVRFSLSKCCSSRCRTDTACPT